MGEEMNETTTRLACPECGAEVTAKRVDVEGSYASPMVFSAFVYRRGPAHRRPCRYWRFEEVPEK